MIDIDVLKQRLEEIGEVKVRERLAINVYGLQERPIVEEWLLSKEREKNFSQMEEYIKIAKNAKYAAWLAAIAAVISALAAIAANLK